MSDVAYSPAACSFACCSRILVMSSCLVSVFRLEEDFSCKVGSFRREFEESQNKKTRWPWGLSEFPLRHWEVYYWRKVVKRSRVQQLLLLGFPPLFQKKKIDVNVTKKKRFMGCWLNVQSGRTIDFFLKTTSSSSSPASSSAPKLRSFTFLLVEL